MPEITQNYIRIPNPKHKGSGCKNIRTIEVSGSIKALYCIEHKVIKTFLFDKDQWTMEEAREWVNERTKDMSEINEKRYIQAEIDKSGLFIASTDAEDREGDVLDVTSWKLQNFKKNPVILWAHNNSEPPVATAESVGIKTVNNRKALVFKPKFHDITDRAREIGKMVKEGIIRTVSVGYIPHDRDGNVQKNLELLEISFVPVPANPEALSLAYSKGIKDNVVKEVFEVPEKESMVFKAFDELNELKNDMSEIKKSLGDIAELAKKSTQREESANIGREPATADKTIVKRQAQIMQKAVETLLKEIKNG